MTMSRREANEKAGTSLAERTRRSTRSMAHELQERRVALISELVSLHQRVASMLKVIMLREGHDALRSALGRQHAIDLHIAERLLNEARSHGIRPGPIAQVEVTALLEEVRYADHHRSDPAARPAALQRALGAVRQHAIRCWSQLMDATNENSLSRLKDEALALQWMEADLYRSLAGLTPQKAER
jgi:hypothetical protein